MFRKNNKSVVNKQIHERSITNSDFSHSKDIFNHSRNPSFPQHLISFKMNNIRKWEDKIDENDKSMNFDEFKKENVSLMKNYKISCVSKTNSTNISSCFSYGSGFAKSDKARNRSQYNESNIIYTNAVDEEFRSPKESFIILDNNKKIYEKIINLGISRLKQKIIEENDKYKSCDEVLNKRIKVTYVNPKKIDMKSAKEKGNLNLLSHLNIDHRTGSIRLSGYYFNFAKNFPEGREQFSFSSDQSETILFGGISLKSFNDLWKFDQIKCEWKKINYEGSSPDPRFGHTSTLYRKKLYIFGGKTKLLNYAILSDLEIFSLEEKTFITPVMNLKFKCKPRRNHIAELVGSQILFHGGFDEDDQILGDVSMLNLEQLKWVEIHIDNNTKSPNLAGHTSCLVIPSEIKFSSKLNLYKFPTDKAPRMKEGIREKGIYVFGGFTTGSVLTNEVWILRIGKKPCDWIKPQIYGNPPSPRYLHSMNFYEEGNFLIIYGGRNDNIESSALNDIYLLELQKLEWIKVMVYSDANIDVYNRCGHSSIVYMNKLIIFGGMNNLNYIRSSFFILNLESCFEYKSNNIKKDSTEGVSLIKESNILRKQSKFLNKDFNLSFNLVLPSIKK